jgi:O-antigen/teichoic acid export membrane protein
MERFRRLASGLLDRAGAAAKADARYVAHGVAWLSVGQAITSLAALGTSIAFAHLMPKETFGTYKYVLSIAGLFSAISLTGLPTALSASAARGQDGALDQGFRLALRWSLPAGAAAALCGAYYLAHGNETLGWGLVAMGVIQPLIDAFALAFALLSGKKLFRARAVYTFFQTLSYTALLIAAVAWTGDALPAIVAGAIGNLAGYIGVYEVAKRRHVSAEAPRDPELQGYAKHLSLMNVLGTVSGQIDKVLLFQFLGPAQVALWSFAQAPVSHARQISKILGNVILPKVAQAELSQVRRTAIPRAFAILALSVAIFAAYWIAAPYVYTFLFPGYTEAVTASRVYALAILATPFVLFKQTLIGHRKTRELYAVNGIQPAIKIGLVAASIPWGIVGVATAFAVSEILNLALSGFFFERATRGSA